MQIALQSSARSIQRRVRSSGRAGGEGVDEFDKIDLKTSQNYAWALEGSPQNTFLREVFSRDVQRDMGRPYPRSPHHHLSFDGHYWCIYEFEARASLGVRQTEAAACAAATGRLIWDADSLNAAAGYHVYLWPPAAAAPAVTDYVYTTGAVTALPLADLLAAGALPESRDPIALNVALTAFDAAGNLSALSESVGFDWQVLAGEALP